MMYVVEPRSSLAVVRIIFLHKYLHTDCHYLPTLVCSLVTSVMLTACTGSGLGREPRALLQLAVPSA